MRVYLPKATYQMRDFSNSLNPQSCTGRTRFVSPIYPYYSVFHELSLSEERAGLLVFDDIGFRRQWEELLESQNIQIEGHT